MPLDLPTVDAVNAVFFVDEGDWRDRVARLLESWGAPAADLESWLAVLDARASGALMWNEALAGGLLPNGRPCPPIRRFNDALLSSEGADAPLPVLQVASLRLGIDVWGPGEPAGEPGTLGIEFLAHRRHVHPWLPGTRLWDGTFVDASSPEQYAKLSHYGDGFAAAMAHACEVLEPEFALSDGMQPVGDFLAQANTGNVVHPAPPGARLADYAWALTYWGPARVDERLSRSLEALDLPVRTTTFPHGVAPRVRVLATGGIFLQVRHILGSEGRGDRAAVETPLAKALGLRSNHLLYRC